jgi:formate dehydrogenase major subunit
MGSGVKPPHSKPMPPGKLEGTRTVPSICPYCAVGCGLEVSVRAGQIINVEGDPASPINEGTLCPKGSASLQLSLNASRWTHVRYRPPRSSQWQFRPLSWAMGEVAQRIKTARDLTFEESRGGMPVMRTGAIACLGGAVFDNEENYALVKLLRGLGVFRIENQARV